LLHLLGPLRARAIASIRWEEGRFARITDTIQVRVCLICIRHGWTIVARVAQTIIVVVLLASVRRRWAVIACVTNTITVGVCLIHV
jgi:hypothetical protein